MQAQPVHWTTYVQTFAVIASTIGTFVYVYFTYHIMKKAIDQGRAAMRMAEFTLASSASAYYHLLISTRQAISMGQLLVRVERDEDVKECIRYAIAVFEDGAAELRSATRYGTVPVTSVGALERWCKAYEDLPWLGSSVHNLSHDEVEKRFAHFLKECVAAVEVMTAELARITSR